MRASVAQKTVQVTAHASVTAYGLSQVQVTDIGPSHGAQSETVKLTGVGTGTETTRYVNGVVYFKANAIFLEIEFNITNSKYANKRISVKKGQKDYTEISEGMYTSSISGQLSPVGTLSKATVTYKGHSAIEITGNASATQGIGKGKVHLYVSTQTPYLPLGESVATVVQGENFTGSVTLSNWKLAVTALEPASSTPINQTNL